MTDSAQQTHSKTGRRAIVFGITDSLYFALGTFLIGFLKHNPDDDGGFVVFHENLSEAQKDLLRAIHPATEFHRFDKQIVLDRLAGIASAPATERILGRYSHFYFAKFEIFDLLSDYDKLVWLDVDMLARGRLDRLWDFEHFTWRETFVVTQTRQAHIYDGYRDVIKKEGYKSPNGGLIGVDRSARSLGEVSTQRAYLWFLDVLARFSTHQGDEITLYLMAAAIGADVAKLPVGYNFPADARGVDEARLVHSVGPRKFWTDEAFKLAYPDWWIWHREWVARGGAPVAAKLNPSPGLKIPGDIFRHAQNVPHWTNLFAELWDKLPDAFIPDVSLSENHWRIFKKGCPRDVLHLRLELVSPQKGYKLGVVVTGKATQNAALMEEVTGLVSALTGVTRSDVQSGTFWSRIIPAEKLTPALTETCQALAGLRPEVLTQA